MATVDYSEAESPSPWMPHAPQHRERPIEIGVQLFGQRPSTCPNATPNRRREPCASGPHSGSSLDSVTAADSVVASASDSVAASDSVLAVPDAASAYDFFRPRLNTKCASPGACLPILPCPLNTCSRFRARNEASGMQRRP